MLITIIGGGHVRFYVIRTSVCATTNNDLTMEDRYSGLICQHALENILNVSQGFIKFLHQLTKPHGIFGQFPNIQKENKEAYNYNDGFIHLLKEDNVEHIAAIYFRDVTDMTTRNDYNEKVFLPHHTSKH